MFIKMQFAIPMQTLYLVACLFDQISNYFSVCVIPGNGLLWKMLLGGAFQTRNLISRPTLKCLEERLKNIPGCNPLETSKTVHG